MRKLQYTEVKRQSRERKEAIQIQWCVCMCAWYVCVYVDYVHVHVGASAHVCVCLCAKARGQHQAPPITSHLPVLRQAFSLNLEISSATPAGQWAPRNLLFLCPAPVSCARVTYCPWILCGCWGPELRPSCLCRRHFINLAFSSTAQCFFF